MGSCQSAQESPSNLHLERFLLSLLCQAPKEDTLKALVENNLALESLTDYLLENSEDVCRLVLPVFTGDKFNTFLMLELKRIIDKQHEGFNGCLDNAQALLSLVVEAIPKFLLSPHYNNWRQKELKETLLYRTNKKKMIGATLPELTSTFVNPFRMKHEKIHIAEATVSAFTSQIVTEFDASDQTICESMVSVEANPVTDISRMPSLYQAMDSCDQVEISSLFKQGNWVPSLIAAAETMPIGITVSKAAHQSPCGYPLIYGNKYFERLSKYDRQDLVGLPGTFLQTRETMRLPNQTVVFDRLFNALRQCESTVAVLTCSRGVEHFTNVIGVLPVTDQNDVLRYVITIQMDVTRFTNIMEKYKMVLSLIETLPRKINR
mmetsp:Transcript_10763/g.10789  ORF Transcript_10763/g.10789 Transcript_10763/m.10789 type:complete len:377 (+) Transcript_10763:93-1223(+)